VIAPQMLVDGFGAMQQLYNPMGQMQAQQMMQTPQALGTQEIVINTETQAEDGQKTNT